jgi:hypothetical protein
LSITKLSDFHTRQVSLPVGGEQMPVPEKEIDLVNQRAGAETRFQPVFA